MRKTSMSISTLIALAGAAAMSAGAAIAEAVQPKTQCPSLTSQAPRSYRRPGRAYPEQSVRPRLRGHRRAQGGYGLEKFGGVWSPRRWPRN